MSFTEELKRLEKNSQICDFCGEKRTSLDIYQLDSTDRRRFNICAECIAALYKSLRGLRELIRMNLKNGKGVLNEGL